MSKFIMIHPDKCTGCKNCVIACSFEKEHQFRPAAARIHVYSWERECVSVPMMCQQCSDAPCASVCPTGAMSHEHNTTRFYSLMLTFIMGLIGLVSAQNLLMVYLCWEIIGLCSYFLVGFWYTENVAVKGARKVLIMRSNFTGPGAS